ncbi:MAG: hypothetical protein GVY02_07800 [Bacteroidetes bacterium]|nr:hypothetical protein [Bacteroidota bacterium]
MKSHHQTIQCPMPDCNGSILFDTYRMLEGAKYACPGCGAEIGIASDSKEKVKKTMGKFERMKEKLMNK